MVTSTLEYRRARVAFAFSEIRFGLRLTTGNDPVWVLSLFWSLTICS